MLFVFGCSNSRRCSVLLAHVGAGLRVSVVLVAAEVVVFRTQVRPHNGIRGTASLGLSFRRELVGASGSRCRRRSRPAGGRGSGGGGGRPGCWRGGKRGWERAPARLPWALVWPRPEWRPGSQRRRLNGIDLRKPSP